MEHPIFSYSQNASVQHPIAVDKLFSGSRRQFEERHEGRTASPVRELVRMLWRSKWPILASAIIGGVLTGGLGLARAPLYESKTQLITSVASNASAAVGAGVSQEAVNEAIDGHLAVLMSEAHMRRVVDGLRAQGAKSVLAALQKEGEPTGIAAAIDVALRSAAANVRVAFGSGNPALDPTYQDKDAALIETLQKGVRVGQELRSRVIGIGFSNKDPAAATLVANTFAQTYMDYLVKKSRVALEADLAEMDGRMPQVREELVSAIRRKEDFIVAHGVFDRQGVNSKLEELAQLRRVLSRTNASLALPSVSSTAAPGHTELLQSEKTILLQKIAAIETDVMQSANRISEMQALDLVVDAEANRFKESLAKRNAIRQRLRTPEPNISILSAASFPTDPKTLSPVFLIPPGMVLFALLASVFILLRRNFDESFRTESDVEQELGIPLAGALPKLDRVTANELQNLIRDESTPGLKRAASSILVSVIGSNPHQVLLVTSSTSRECKTELAWSLALSGQRFGRSVLFIDLDTNESELTRQFSLKFAGRHLVKCSFADVVEGRCEISDEAETPRAAIHFMPAPPNPSDFLAQLPVRDARRSLNKLRDKYGLVIINAPSSIDAPEMRLLVQLTDCVLFAVASDLTKRRDARAVLKSIIGIADRQINVAGVLTNMRARRSASRSADPEELVI